MSRCQPSDRAHLEELDNSAHGPRVVARSGTREPSPAALCALRYALDALSERVRETLNLRYARGLSCEEIAARQRVSLSCVKTRLHRARRRVREALLDEPESANAATTRGNRCGPRG